MWRLLLMALLCWPAIAAENAPHRFVFLIDASQSMASRQAAVVKTVRSLVQSGFGGQAMAGDRVELWSFGARLRTNQFPAALWDGPRAPLLAESAAQFLSAEKFRGRAEFRNVAPAVRAWAATQTNALFFLVTDGLDPVAGVPGDIEMNEYLAPRRAKARAAKRVFLLSMLIRDGRFAEWKGHDGLGKADLPLLPEREAEKPVVVEKAPPAAPAPVAQAEAPPPVVELPPGAKVVIADTPPPPIPVPAPAPVVVEAVPPEPVVDPPKAEPVVVAAEEPVPPVTVAALTPAPVIVAPENPRPTFYYALGAGTLLLLLALRLFFRRRPAEGASLISKSLSQK